MSSAIEQLAANVSFSALSKAEDLKKRIWFTLLVLIIYRLGTYIPLPGINAVVVGEFTRQHSGGIVGMLEMFSGGAIGRMAIFSLSITPYITASIIVQLMTAILPQFEALKKEGESGRKKLNHYTRYATVVIALSQAYMLSAGLERLVGASGPAVMDPGMFFRINSMITLTGGTLFIMWLGEQITSRGIGNGSSLIIYAGIVANLPQAVINTFILGREGSVPFFVIIGVLAMVAFLIGYVVFMEKSQRRITVQYPKRQTEAGRPAASQSSHLPIKLNAAGVIPPIFASSILVAPMTILAFIGKEIDRDTWWGWVFNNLSHGKPLFILLFVTFIIFFAFFYTAIIFNPAETSENLKKAGGFIPGIRPGKSTAEYLDYVLTRLTAVGGVYLASVCVIPEFILSQVALPFYLGGTSLLIVVGVTIDTLTQFQSYLIAHQYEGLLKKARTRFKGN
jgi:preprotein translocase subunit SecY